MSTSGSAQLENESQVANGNHHHHTPHQHCRYYERFATEGEKSRGCDFHECTHNHTSTSNGHPQTGYEYLCIYIIMNITLNL